MMAIAFVLWNCFWSCFPSRIDKMVRRISLFYHCRPCPITTVFTLHRDFLMQELFTIFLVLCMAAMGTCRSVDFSLLQGGQTNVMNYGAVGNGATDDSQVYKIIFTIFSWLLLFFFLFRNENFGLIYVKRTGFYEGMEGHLCR